MDANGEGRNLRSGITAFNSGSHEGELMLLFIGAVAFFIFDFSLSSIFFCMLNFLHVMSRVEMKFGEDVVTNKKAQPNISEALTNFKYPGKWGMRVG